jgi:hypothetical protein
VIDAIEELEKDTGKVVITSNQALAWEMMRNIGIGETRSGYGAPRKGRKMFVHPERRGIRGLRPSSMMP